MKEAALRRKPNGLLARLVMYRHSISVECDDGNPRTAPLGDRGRIAYLTGKRIVEMVAEDLRPWES